VYAEPDQLLAKQWVLGVGRLRQGPQRARGGQVVDLVEERFRRDRQADRRKRQKGERDRGIVVPCASVQQNDCVVLAHARSFA